MRVNHTGNRGAFCHENGNTSTKADPARTGVAGDSGDFRFHYRTGFFAYRLRHHLRDPIGSGRSRRGDDRHRSPSFAGAAVKYTSNTFTTATAASFSITFTLPTGVTFANNPSATGDGTVFAAALSEVSGGIGDNFITFTGTANIATALQGTVSLGAFNVAGATALQSPNTTSFSATASVSSTIGALNDTGVKAQLASSASEIEVATAPTVMGSAQVIDVAAPSLGMQWKQFGADTLTADDGAVVLVAPPGLAAANDTTQNVPPTTGTIALTGVSWGGVSTPSLLPGATTQPGTGTSSGCPATLPAGTVTGTIAGDVITFPNVVPPAVGAFETFYEVCLGVTGKSLIASNVTTSAAVTSPTGVTTVAGGTLTGLNSYNYNGSVQQILYSFVQPPYSAYIRITNNTEGTATVVTSVQPETGTSGTTTTSVPGNSNVLIPAGTLISGSGVSLNSTGRVSMLFLTPGTPCTNNGLGQSCSVSVSQFLVNPTGEVTPGGSGAAP